MSILPRNRHGWRPLRAPALSRHYSIHGGQKDGARNRPYADKRRGRFSAALCFALLWLTAGAVLAAAPDFPALTGRVVDEAGILSAQAESELAAQLAAHEQATSNQVVVVTLKSLRGYEISDYGVQLGRHWGIGQKGKNNGALLIVAPAERKLRIEVGYGLEGVLTDAVSRDIIERVIKPRFRQQNYEQGIRAGIGAMLAALSGEPSALPPVTAVGSAHDWGYLFFLFFLAPLFAGFGRSRSGRRPSLGSRVGKAVVFGAIAGTVVWFMAQLLLLALVIGFVVFVLALLSRGRLGGDGGHYGGGWGGGDSGGFSGGGGSFGGGGASGDW